MHSEAMIPTKKSKYESFSTVTDKLEYVHKTHSCLKETKMKKLS